VLGNHDHDAGRAGEVARVLTAAGVTVLDESTSVFDVGGVEVAVVGAIGHPGGFAEAPLDGIAPAARMRARDRAEAQAEALDQGLRRIARCQVRVVLLHYAPTTSTLRGEPERLWGWLGAEALAEPIRRHRPDIVVHAHAHSGTFRGAVGPVPAFNVSADVLGRELCHLALQPAECPRRTPAPG
jgi:Icc-related predicted phosphoesterase